LVFLRRLHDLKTQMENENEQKIKLHERPFGEFSGSPNKSGIHPSMSPRRLGYIPTSSANFKVTSPYVKVTSPNAKVTSPNAKVTLPNVKVTSPNKIIEYAMDGMSMPPNVSPTKDNVSPHLKEIYDPGR